VSNMSEDETKKNKELNKDKRTRRKCPICQAFGYVDEMIDVKDTGKSKPKYVHSDKCYTEYIEQRKVINHENDLWGQLYEYVRRLHGLIISDEEKLDVPIQIITRLKSLRNGRHINAQGEVIKTFKMGATYDLILDAYKLADKDIQWSIQYKLGGSNDAKAMSYCLSIMVDNLNEAWMNKQKISKNEKKATKILSDDVEYEHDLDFEDLYSNRKIKDEE